MTAVVPSWYRCDWCRREYGAEHRAGCPATAIEKEVGRPTFFLAELRERARRYGWRGDYVEVEKFVRALYEDEGIDLTDDALEPYEEDDDA